MAEDLKVLMDVTSFIDLRYITDFLTTTDEAERSELNVVQERLLEQAVFLQHKEGDDYTTPEPSAKKIKLSLGALTSLKKPKERPSAAQSPRDRLSAEIGHYINIPLLTVMKIH